MKFSTIPLLVTALVSVAAADDIVYGRMYTSPQQNTARTPDVKAVKHAYSRIEGQLFSLAKRLTNCGIGSTCMRACENCGTPWCGIEDPDGTCICASASGICVDGSPMIHSATYRGDGEGNGSGSEGGYAVSPYCGWGATCRESCDACGTSYCGVRLPAVGNACVCRSGLGECPPDSPGGVGGEGRGDRTSSDSGTGPSTTSSGTDLPKSTGDVSSETTTSENSSSSTSTTQDSALPQSTTQTSETNLRGTAAGRMEVAVGAAVVGVAALVMVL
ncbi:hypothetical protein V501_09295 [Pseudogymnoascus sp. VKM F-4519 (FW-2642)]|nr:hypothetical protein V501_09295 [Pseudogymnoascus sp. VKM F-4519 (FW-2642)]